MAHSNRDKQREKRKAKKAAIKAAKRAVWAALVGKPGNKKKRGSLIQGQSSAYARILAKVWGSVNGVKTIVERTVHGGPECGNIGCKRCSSTWRIA